MMSRILTTTSQHHVVTTFSFIIIFHVFFVVQISTPFTIVVTIPINNLGYIQYHNHYFINNAADDARISKKKWLFSRNHLVLCAQRTSREEDDKNEEERRSSYETSASVTKGIVSSLTSITNAIFGSTSSNTQEEEEENQFLPSQSIPSMSLLPPTSPKDLLFRIQNEYITNNYLWTGNIDTSCFVTNCTFTDPTLSFRGVDQYVKNVGNLVPIVNYLLGRKQSQCRSDLLNITLNQEQSYIETRWNMVGELDTLLWKPRIDVIGRTKFWYQPLTLINDNDKAADDNNKNNTYYQVYYYDEKWEIPAVSALLQLITKAGTIANTREE